jgi:hypothetical protein
MYKDSTSSNDPGIETKNHVKNGLQTTWPQSDISSLIGFNKNLKGGKSSPIKADWKSSKSSDSYSLDSKAVKND